MVDLDRGIEGRGFLRATAGTDNAGVVGLMAWNFSVDLPSRLTPGGVSG